MFSLDEIWAKLTTSAIGFYTSRTSGDVPSRPGVYAWFLPLRLQGDPEALVRLGRLVLSYDCPSRGTGKWSTEGAGFRWDPLRVELARQPEVQLPKSVTDHWNAIQGADKETNKTLRIAMMAASIFSKPLYVGLSRNLATRYKDHTASSSGFKTRFESYMKELDMQYPVERLIFVCVPLSGSALSSCTDDQISVLESLLKILCQPAFGDQ